MQMLRESGRLAHRQLIVLRAMRRNLYNPDSQRFELNNLQDWQHATMYAAFLASGLVDLIGHYAPRGTLPAGLEHVRMRSLPPHHAFL